MHRVEPMIIAALVSFSLGCGSGPPQGGVLVDEVLGVVMPQGTYRMAQEMAPEPGGPARSMHYLVSPRDIDQLDWSFGQAANRSSGHRHDLEGGVTVTVRPIDDIPQTSTPPERPVVERPPPGMESWIVVRSGG